MYSLWHKQSTESTVQTSVYCMYVPSTFMFFKEVQVFPQNNINSTMYCTEAVCCVSQLAVLAIHELKSVRIAPRHRSPVRRVIFCICCYLSFDRRHLRSMSKQAKSPVHAHITHLLREDVCFFLLSQKSFTTHLFARYFCGEQTDSVVFMCYALSNA